MDIKRILQQAQTIAVVGCSPRETQPSHRIALYLQQAGYTIVPVNPRHDVLLGVPCYADLHAIPDGVTIDIVDIFRRPEFTLSVVQDAITRAQRTQQTPVIWTQFGVHHEDAQHAAEAAGLPYVANRCLMVEHAAL